MGTVGRKMGDLDMNNQKQAKDVGQTPAVVARKPWQAPKASELPVAKTEHRHKPPKKHHSLNCGS